MIKVLLSRLYHFVFSIESKKLRIDFIRSYPDLFDARIRFFLSKVDSNPGQIHPYLQTW